MLKITEPKKVLCIHDLSGVGRCSLAVILPVLSVMGPPLCRWMAIRWMHRKPK